jgi:competence ComEA-like helix-hairpin-helix protein
MNRAIFDLIRQFFAIDNMKQTIQNRIQSFAFVISVFLAISLSLCSFLSLERGKSVFAQCNIKLDGRINPNNAPIESLVRLPGLGIGRAGAIAEYRDNLDTEKSGRQPFQNYDDLQKVKGIGPRTVQNINGLLKFN